MPAKRIPESDPNNAADYYFLGFTHWFIKLEVTQLPLYPYLLRAGVDQLSGLDFKDPLATSERYLRTAAQLDPEYYWVHLWLGETLIAAGKPESAELCLNCCVALRPFDPVGCIVRANTISQQVEKTTDPRLRSALTERAFADLDNALQLRSDSPEIDFDEHFYCVRGKLHRQSGEFDEAIKDYNTATHLNPKYAVAFNDRGFTWYARKDYDEAIKDYDEAIRLDPKYGTAFNNRGLAWRAKGENDKAIKDYDEAIRLNPKYAVRFNNRGLAWRAKGENDKAIKDYDEAIRLEPKYAVAFNNRGYAWYAKRDYDKAIEDYDKAISHDPKYANAFNNRGLAWRAKEEYDKAIKDYDEAIRLNSNLAKTFANRGNAWLGKKDYNRAIADFDIAVGLDPKYANSWGDRANSRWKLKENDKAASDFEAAMGLNPPNWLQRDYALFLATCAEAKYRDGQRAVGLAKKAFKLASQSANTGKYLAALAAAHAEAGEFDDAVKCQMMAMEDATYVKEQGNAVSEILALYRDKHPFHDK